MSVTGLVTRRWGADWRIKTVPDGVRSTMTIVDRPFVPTRGSYRDALYYTGQVITLRDAGRALIVALDRQADILLIAYKKGT